LPDTLILSLAVVVASLAVLVWSASIFIDGAASTATALGVSPLIIGLTIVGFGTSAPEILISIFSATQGNPGLAIGNAIGSNIANIALVLGLTTLLFPLLVSQSVVRREMSQLVIVLLVLLALFADSVLSRIDGAILLVLMLLVIARTVYQGMRSVTANAANPLGSNANEALPGALIKLVIGLVVLLASSRALVWGAVDIANAMGISDLVIGLTIVAVGTSLPELAACIASARKRAYEIAIGNIIGSNVFNSLAVIGISSTIHPSALPDGVLTRDMPIGFGLTLALLAMCYRPDGNLAILGRCKGGILLSCFIAYQIILFTPHWTS
jgi:cation:H+ antiporter